MPLIRTNIAVMLGDVDLPQIPVGRLNRGDAVQPEQRRQALLHDAEYRSMRPRASGLSDGIGSIFSSATARPTWVRCTRSTLPPALGVMK
jgi:hypothetical protein